MGCPVGYRGPPQGLPHRLYLTDISCLNLIPFLKTPGKVHCQPFQVEVTFPLWKAFFLSLSLILGWILLGGSYRLCQPVSDAQQSIQNVVTLNNQFFCSRFYRSIISAGLSWEVLLLFLEGLLMHLWSVPLALLGAGWCMMVSPTFLAIGSLSAMVEGMHGPWVSQHPLNPRFFTWLFSCVKSTKRGQTLVCKHFSILSLLHSCYCSTGQSKFHLQGQGKCGRRYRQTCTKYICYCNSLLLR